MRGCQHFTTIMSSASRTIQKALAIPVTGLDSAFTDCTNAKQRHVCAIAEIGGSAQDTKDCETLSADAQCL